MKVMILLLLLVRYKNLHISCVEPHIPIIISDQEIQHSRSMVACQER